MDVTWRFIPASEVEPVHPVARQRARSMLRVWMERMRDRDPADTDPVPDETRLHPVGEARLEALVPDPPLVQQRAAIDTVRGGHRRALLLRPDDGSWDAALDEPERAGPDRPLPPDAPPWRAGLPDAVRARLRDPAPVHVPHLERWYVRHHDGLGALRELLAELGARDGEWTADVTPWAWGWMRHVLPEARALPAPHAVAPMRGDALREWFEPFEDVRVRRRVAGPPDRAVFDALAARSRGSAGVAAAIWRTCLRDGAEEKARERAEGRERDDDEEAGDERQRQRIVWMRHPLSVPLPDTTRMDRDDIMVLHTVLVHGSASAATVRRALPLAHGSTEAALAGAVSRGVVSVGPDGRHRILPAALPAVRDRLRSEAFAQEMA